MEHLSLRPKADDEESCCYRRLIAPTRDHGKTQCNQLIIRYQHFIRRIRYNRRYIAINPALAMVVCLAMLSLSYCAQFQVQAFSSAAQQQQQLDPLYAQPSQQQQQQQQQFIHHSAQARIGGLEASDYVDEAGELDVMANQQQIPTAQLMAAAGHIVPENFFLPGGTIPALYPRYLRQQQLQQQQQQQQHQMSQQQQQQQQQQAAESQQQPQHISPLKYGHHLRQADLLAAASAAVAADQSAAAAAAENQQLIDFNSYNLIAQQDGSGRDAGSVPAPMDLAEFLGPEVQRQALYEQQQQQLAEQQLAAELATLQQHQVQHNQHQHHHQHHHQQQQQQQQQQLQQNVMDNMAQASENSPVVAAESYGQSIGPAYQISGHSSQNEAYTSYGSASSQQQQQQQQGERQEKPFGQPTKSSSKEPSGMLKPLGNPKTISSPVIDFVTNQLPKSTNLEKVVDKLPQHQTPTVFSFASSKDPMEKVKGVNQKKRNVMRQAEQLAKAMIKSVNDKFGTTIGDQTDIPFLLSTLGPLGLAQNILFDPTLLVTLLNSAEKTYFSDALPAPAKMAIRPVLNIFRVPNRKRDKANLLNIISYLASGGQTPSSTVSGRNRVGLGVEKQANKNKSKE